NPTHTGLGVSRTSKVPVQRVPARRGSGGGSIGLVILVVATAAVFWFRGELFGPSQEVAVISNTDRTIASTPKPSIPAPPATTEVVIKGPSISLYLNVRPRANLTVLTVNDRPVSTDTMTTVVPLDKSITIFAEKKGYKPVRRETFYDSKTYGK